VTLGSQGHIFAVALCSSAVLCSWKTSQHDTGLQSIPYRYSNYSTRGNMKTGRSVTTKTAIDGAQKSNDLHHAGQPKTLSVAEAARYSGLGQDAIRDAVCAGALKAIRIGRIIRISTEIIDDFIRRASNDELNIADLRPARRASWRSQQPARRRSTR